MRLRPHRRNLVVWSPSAGPVGRYGVPGFTRIARTRRIRRWIRTGGLLTVIGLIRLASAVRTRWRPLLAGGVLTAVSVMLRSGVDAILKRLLTGTQTTSRTSCVTSSPAKPWPPVTTGLRAPDGAEDHLQAG